MGHVGAFHWVVVLWQSLQLGVLGACGHDVVMQLGVGVCACDGSSSAVVAGIDVALPVCAGDDTVLAKLESTAQNGVLQGGPHLGEGECGGPCKGGVARGV